MNQTNELNTWFSLVGPTLTFAGVVTIRMMSSWGEFLNRQPVQNVNFINLNIEWKIINDDDNWVHSFIRNEGIKNDIARQRLQDELRSNLKAELMDVVWNPRNNIVRQRLQEEFRRSNLKAELMAVVWHPRNFEKFRYLDEETFGEEF